MGLWKFLGGEINHKAINKWNQRMQEENIREIKSVCSSIMLHGIPRAFNSYNVTEDKVKKVLKMFPECPKFDVWGKDEISKKNWKQAQQWLYDQEHSELKETQSELQNIKNKMQEMEKKLAEYEKKK